MLEFGIPPVVNLFDPKMDTHRTLMRIFLPLDVLIQFGFFEGRIVVPDNYFVIHCSKLKHVRNKRGGNIFLGGSSRYSLFTLLSTVVTHRFLLGEKINAQSFLFVCTAPNYELGTALFADSLFTNFLRIILEILGLPNDSNIRVHSFKVGGFATILTALEHLGQEANKSGKIMMRVELGSVEDVHSKRRTSMNTYAQKSYRNICALSKEVSEWVVHHGDLLKQGIAISFSFSK